MVVSTTDIKWNLDFVCVRDMDDSTHGTERNVQSESEASSSIGKGTQKDCWMVSTDTGGNLNKLSLAKDEII